MAGDIKSCQITDDPTKNLSVGHKIVFNNVGLQKSDALRQPRGVVNWEYFKGSICGLVLKSENSTELIGSAAIVAPGIALTATHNFGDQFDDLSQEKIQPYLFGICGDCAQIWRVSKISHDLNDDIAILSIAAASGLPPKNTYYRIGATTRAPKNGDNVTIVGFRGDGIDWCKDNITFGADLYISKGVVVSVFPEGRDKLLIPFPAIEIDCGSLGGMSGGAALDQNGSLIGVVARGWETSDRSGPTYISWIISSLGRRIEPVWPCGLYENNCALAEVDARLFSLEGRDAITLDDGRGLNYNIWF